MMAEEQGRETIAGAGDASGADAVYMHKIWERRATRLAQVPQQENLGVHIPLVLIRLGTETYALDAHHVFEIRTVEQITPVPRTPTWVAGIVNVRGRVISVLDLRRFLKLTDRETPEEKSVEVPEATPEQFIVVVETSKTDLALLVDEVLTLKSVPESQIQEAGETVVLSICPEYVRGIVKEQAATESGNALHAEVLLEASLIILNIPALLGDKKLIVQEEL